MYNVLIRNNGLCRLTCQDGENIMYMNFGGLAELVNFCTAHFIEVCIADVDVED